MVGSEAGEVRKGKKDVLLMSMPGEMKDDNDAALLEQEKPSGLGVPTDPDIAAYFKNPEKLAVDRRKKGGYGGGSRDENAGEYEK